MLVAPQVRAQAAVKLGWDAPELGPTPDGYNIYASKESGKYGSPLGTTPELTLTLPTLPLGRWYFAATAFNEAGESDKSEEISTITLAPPKNLKLESGTNYMFPQKLVWDKSGSSSVYGDVKYRVYRRNRFPETSTWFIVTETMNNYYSAQVLQAGQFVYRVSTLKGEFESSNSSNDLNIRVGLAAKQE